MNPIKHVAIIMDGNGRWGLKKKNNRNFGHQEGLKVVEKIINYSIKKKIRYLTLYAFSTENWKRPKKEIRFLFKLLEEFLINRLNNLKNKNIKLLIIGKKNFSKKINSLLKKSEIETFNNRGLQINLALNYGSKSEIVYSIKKIIKQKKKISEKNISQNIYTKNIPDPDLLIRTGNTNRLSNFLLWQLAYSEIYFEKKLWPDFNQKDYKKILDRFKKVKRNYGNV